MAEQAIIDEVMARATSWAGVAAEVRPLSGGLTNHNYLVAAGAQRFVVRIPGRATELLAVDRENELHNTRAAAEAGVGPRVLEHFPDLQVMVLEYLEGETMSGVTLRSPEMARRMGESLRMLHAGPRFLQDFDMFRLVEYYLGVVDEHRVRIPEDYLARQPVIAEVERALGAHPLPTVPCHNDLMAENYIFDGARLRILDYEYSGNNDPCFELGNTAQECAFDEDLRARLCESYFGRADPFLLARMNLNALMSDVGWTLWAAIQAKISTIDFDFWGWAEERWGRAVEVLDSDRLVDWLRDVRAGARGPFSQAS